MLKRFFLLAASCASYVAGTWPTEQPDWSKPRFSGKRVLITGGDSGIGFAAAEAFYLECAHVILSGHSEPKSMLAAQSIASLAVPAACKDSMPSVTWMAADISNTSEVQALMKFAVEQHSGLDVAVNNAGTGSAGHDIGQPGFVQPDGSLYGENVLDINLDGTLKCMNAQIRHWLDAKQPGNIINIASVCGETAVCQTMYTSSKWAMEGFMRQAALQYARSGIRINTVDPGAVNTTMLRDGLSPTDPAWLEKKKAFDKMIPVHRIAEPWEMAGPITFLASDMASYVTGTSLTADGGFTLPAATLERSGQALTATKPVQTAEEGPKHWGAPRFAGKRVLVTGGDAGIGYAAAQAFYMECAEVLVVGHNATKSQEACQQLQSLSLPQACAQPGSNPRVYCTGADISNTSQVQAVMKAAVESFGSIDIAVNNAGIYDHHKQQIGDAGFLDQDGALADKAVMDVNLLGTLKCMHFEIDHWLSRNATGSIINIASIFGEVAWGAPVYTSTKWAMIGFTKHAALTYAGQGIRINAVAPGFVNTTMLRGNSTWIEWVVQRKVLEEMVPLHRIAEPWEMAGPITFLASDMANYVTGATLTADGGVTLVGPMPTGASDSMRGAVAGHRAAESLGDSHVVTV